MTTPTARPLHWIERLLMGVGGTILATLLITAAWLSPSRVGMGTHQQLGLPPCTFVVLYGTRCPSCGMTTSWSHLMKGNLWGSVRANSAGCLLGFISLVASPWLISSAVVGRSTLKVPSDRTLILITIIVVLVILGDWIFRLRFG